MVVNRGAIISLASGCHFINFSIKFKIHGVFSQYFFAYGINLLGQIPLVVLKNSVGAMLPVATFFIHAPHISKWGGYPIYKPIKPCRACQLGLA